MKRLLTSVICTLAGLNAVMMAESGRPRLVVGIMVDQLRSDYVEYLRDLFGEKGFRRLADKGVYMRDVDFKAAGLDAGSAAAVAFTGNYPSSTGIAPGGDPFTTPEALRLSTITDEVAIDGAGLGALYSIAPDAATAVIMAGHAGNSAVWISDENGRWTSSSYYSALPQPASLRNGSKSLPQRLDTIVWRPALPLDKYPGVPAQKRYYPFSYTFPRSDRNVYSMFKTSPLVNREVTDLAVDYLRSLKLGSRGDAIDMLNVGYTAAPFKYVKDGDFRLELEDSYIRLDSQLGRLLDAIDEYVGLDNTVVYLTSTGYYDDSTPDDAKFRIPGGEISTKRAVSLLNSFLSASYGNGDYVERYSNGHIFFNRRLLEEKRLRVNDVCANARQFLVKMSGVDNIYTLEDLLSPSTDYVEALRLSVDPKDCGDLIMVFTPGWTVNDDFKYPVKHYTVRSAVAATPAIIMAPGVEPRVISTPVDAALLAPTVTGILRIRSPNGALRSPMMF